MGGRCATPTADPELGSVTRGSASTTANKDESSVDQPASDRQKR
jgi:hypothetical protein